mgnify:CR=1 FL=1
MQKALFLDRDGVINFDKGYVYKIDDFEFIHGIFKVCRHYMSLGFVIVVVTNQAGIARKYYTELDFHKLDLWMVSQFQKHNVDILQTYFCPHHPHKGFKGENIKFKVKCICRKPKPGLLYLANREFNLDLKKSFFIGDSSNDYFAALKAKVKPIIINKNFKHNKKCVSKRNILEAVNYIIN